MCYLYWSVRQLGCRGGKYGCYPPQLQIAGQHIKVCAGPGWSNGSGEFGAAIERSSCRESKSNC